jgi:hypothetical protein
VDRRLGEFERWHRKMQEPDWAEIFQQEVTEGLLREWVRFGRLYRRQMKIRLRDGIEYAERRLRRSLGL